MHSNLIVDFLTKEFKSVISYSISNPFVIRCCLNSKTTFKLSDNSIFYLKIPRYSEIMYLNFVERNKNINFGSLDISTLF